MGRGGGGRGAEQIELGGSGCRAAPQVGVASARELGSGLEGGQHRLGAAIGGSVAPGIDTLARMVKHWGGRGESTLLLFGDRVPSPQAALVNAAMQSEGWRALQDGAVLAELPVASFESSGDQPFLLEGVIDALAIHDSTATIVTATLGIGGEWY